MLAHYVERFLASLSLKKPGGYEMLIPYELPL